MREQYTWSKVHYTYKQNSFKSNRQTIAEFVTKKETQLGLRSTILPITKVSKPIDTHKVHGHLSNKRKRSVNFSDKKKSTKLKE